MTYPIFNSFVNQIENELTNKDLNLKTFKTWHEDRINAAGLELVIDNRDHNNFIKEVCINLDWDRFRETVLAQQLNGLAEHPMLQDDNLKSVTVSPEIDIEMSWIFNEDKSEISTLNFAKTNRLEKAGEWMSAISKKVNSVLTEDDIITRWHLEMEGSAEHKRLMAVTLISYFKYSLVELQSLNEVHSFVKERIHDLMLKSKKVKYICDHTLKGVA